jgi:hypothetical protein
LRDLVTGLEATAIKAQQHLQGLQAQLAAQQKDKEEKKAEEESEMQSSRAASSSSSSLQA